MITLSHVTVEYKIMTDHIANLKEYAISRMKGKLKYETFLALNDVSMEVKKGEVVGIIGRNGAGKSTLLKVVAGILKPNDGYTCVEGQIAPMLELGSGFDADLTGRENIFLNGAILGFSEQFMIDKYQEIIEFSELEKFIETPIRNYSSGMIMRLAFSIASIVNPDILIVDEILSVGDQAFQRKSKQKMLQMMDGGTTVLFVSHSIDQIREICEKVVWLDQGSVKMMGEAEEICSLYQRYEGDC